MSFHSGIGGTVTIDGHEFSLTRWSVNPTTEIVRFRNSRTARGTVKEPTFIDCTFEFSLDYDDANDPFATPVSLAPGAVLTDVMLFLHNTAAAGDAPVGDYWYFPSSIVNSPSQTLEIEGKITTTIRGEASGPFYTPGNAPTPP